MPTSIFQPIRLLNLDCWYKFTYLMANSADPDQLASNQLIWIYTVCKCRAHPGSAGSGLKMKSPFQKLRDVEVKWHSLAFCPQYAHYRTNRQWWESKKRCHNMCIQWWLRSACTSDESLCCSPEKKKPQTNLFPWQSTKYPAKTLIRLWLCRLI